MKCANCGHDAPLHLQRIDYDYRGAHTRIALTCQKCSRCGTVSFDDANAAAYGNAVKAFQNEVTCREM